MYAGFILFSVFLFLSLSYTGCGHQLNVESPVNGTKYDGPVVIVVSDLDSADSAQIEISCHVPGRNKQVFLGAYHPSEPIVVYPPHEIGQHVILRISAVDAHASPWEQTEPLHKDVMLLGAALQTLETKEAYLPALRVRKMQAIPGFEGHLAVLFDVQSFSDGHTLSTLDAGTNQMDGLIWCNGRSVSRVAALPTPQTVSVQLQATPEYKRRLGDLLDAAPNVLRNHTFTLPDLYLDLRSKCENLGYSDPTRCAVSVEQAVVENGVWTPQEFGWASVNCSSLTLGRDAAASVPACPMSRPLVVVDSGYGLGYGDYIHEVLRIHCKRAGCPSLLPFPKNKIPYLTEWSAPYWTQGPVDVTHEDVKGFCPQAVKAIAGRLTWETIEFMDQVSGDQVQCLMVVQNPLIYPRTFSSITNATSASRKVETICPGDVDVMTRWLIDLPSCSLSQLEIDDGIEAKSRLRRCEVVVWEDAWRSRVTLEKTFPHFSEKLAVESWFISEDMIVEYPSYISQLLLRSKKHFDIEMYDYARHLLRHRVPEPKPGLPIGDWVVPGADEGIGSGLVSSLDFVETFDEPGPYSTRYFGYGPCPGKYFRDFNYYNSMYTCGLLDAAAGRACCCKLRAARSPPDQVVCLPQFHIVGQQKAGTSLLFFHLATLYETPAKRKECNVLAQKVDDRISAHLNCMPPIPLKDTTRYIFYEACPRYMRGLTAARQFQVLYGKQPIIMLVRDPIKRAISQYQMEVTRGALDPVRSAEEMFLEEYHLLRNCLGPKSGVFEFVMCYREASSLTKNQLYLYRGLYSRFAAVWAHLNGDVLILPMEDLVSKNASVVQDTLRKVQRFAHLPLVDIPGALSAEESKRLEARFDMPTWWSQPKEPMTLTPTTMRLLKDFYAPFNAELYQLLGRTLDWL